ncbi:DUF4132 domain-containing protein [Kitasatospora sp. NA04385]|uniref:DUF4132 domain-containing protein n=1 Tax=Kitasatospora sp. NA04385 TaxID=2742135 RepID=UPI0015912FB7|nr:DUF4132 domain-containing protein [Kitasatospora sp. NA04385]QKW22959.1 DUF4132 domain-containing protein [Kitasatospora sp. NA04385]
MRRWELVGDGSAKFWEAGVEGAAVRVRYGRIGGEGREQLKELGSADAAVAHFAKQVAEKERKGYAEVREAGAAVEAGAVGAGGLPDEDAFVLPESWRRAALARRGGRVPEVSRPGPEALERERERIADRGDWVERVLDAPGSDPELVRAARAYLGGAPDAVGAAAVASMLPASWKADAAEHALFTDVWTARHGPAFAVRAMLEREAMETHYLQSGNDVSDIALRRRTPRSQYHGGGFLPAEQRLRALLAAAPEPEHRAALAALAELRDTPRRRALASFLAPGVPGWLDECLADMPSYRDDRSQLQLQLMHSLDDPAQVPPVLRSLWTAWNAWTLPLVASLADGVGTAAAPLVAAGFNQARGADSTREQAAALVHFPTDDAFRALLAKLHDKHVLPALQEAARRYPVRAARLLAEAAAQGGSAGAAARRMLNAHVLLHRELLPQILPRLDAATAALVAALDVARPQAAEAGPEALPPLLVAPPWTRPRTRRAVRVVEGLRPDEEVRLVWRDGEREGWATTAFGGWRYPADTDWAKTAGEVLGESHGLWYAVRLLAQGPEEALAPFLAAWRPTDLWGGSEYLPAVVAKYGAAALPVALHAARAQPANLAPLLLPFLDVRTARQLADGLVRLKSVQPTARSWLVRHGTAGALLLVPDAVGPTGREREAAERALRLVAAADGGAELLAAVSARYGGPAAEAVAEVLAADPLENALPARMPVLPVWAQPAVLPQLLLRAPAEGPGAALPAEAVRHVLTMLALSRPGEPYPGLAVVAEVCRADALAAFGWALFEQWQQAGTPAKESWTLHALGVLGDDTTVRRLTPVVRGWPGEGAHRRAVEGLDVLAAIGTDLALLHLHGIAQRVKFKALKARAQEKIAEVAEGLGLTAEQLGDRLVPDLGLDPDGTTVVDYGTRTFTVGFDEQLRPFVLDADGKRRKDLPAPGAKDDPELAPAERKRFAALKKDVRTVAAEQIRRLEDAMVARRSWSAEEFTSLFVGHPLVWHLARRLVWTAGEGAGATAFRIAEDRTFADPDDAPFVLPADATVRLAHPLLLGEEAVAAWSELFADYEVLQPFPQLGRPVHRFTPEEAAANRLHRFEGCTVPVGRLLGLTKRGWERGVPQDAGVEGWFSKRLADGCHLVIALDEGIAVGLVEEFPDQTFATVWLDSSPGDHCSSREYPLRYGDLDPVTASELLADLEQVTAG